MKLQNLLNMIFELLEKRRITAAYFAEKYEVSTRTVYRYVDLLSAHMPVCVKRGRNGGICLADNCKLPIDFLTKTEYDTTVYALNEAYAHTANDDFLQIKHKLSERKNRHAPSSPLSVKISSILIDGSAWGDARSFSDKIRFIEECICDRAVAEIDCRLPDGKMQTKNVEPHLLVLKRGIWQVYAFCHTERKFILLRLSDIYSYTKTQNVFRRRAFEKEEIIKQNKMDDADGVTVRFEISPAARENAQALFGAENMRLEDGRLLAEVTFPNDETLTGKILHMGSGIKVIFPKWLSLQVQKELRTLLAAYGKD